MASCGRIFAKILLIIFNIIYLAVGGVVMGCAVWFKVDADHDVYGLQEIDLMGNVVFGNRAFEISVYVLIAFGAFIFLFGIFGVLAAIMEKLWMLSLYIVILLVLFGLEVAGGVLAIVYREEIRDKLKVKLLNVIQKPYYKLNETTEMPITSSGSFEPTDEGLVLNFLQFEFECCGIDSYREYDLTYYDFPSTYDITVPWACCVPQFNQMYKHINNATDVINPEQCQELNLKHGFYALPCFESVERWLSQKEAIIIGIALGVAAFQVFGFIFSVCLCVHARNRKEE